MKKQSVILTVVLVASAAFISAAYAQDASSTATASPVVSGAGKAKDKETQKEQLQQESAQLSPDKAKVYNDAMQKAIDSNKDLHTQIRKAYDAADALLVAQEFDKKAYLAKTAEIDQLYAKQRASLSDAFVSVVEKFSQEDRKILLKARNEHRRHTQTQTQ